MGDLAIGMWAASIFLGVLACLFFLLDMWAIFLFRKEIREPQPKVKYHTAVHEAGHAMTVLRSDRVRGNLHLVTTVPDDDSGGRVKYNLTGFPIFVQWEQLIIALGGAAGEFVAQGAVNTHACGKDLEDALKMAKDIAAQHKPDKLHEIVVDAQTLYEERLHPDTRNVLNFCMNAAVRRIRNSEQDFYRLVDTLIDRRELTGKQVQEVLSRK